MRTILYVFLAHVSQQMVCIAFIDCQPHFSEVALKSMRLENKICQYVRVFPGLSYSHQDDMACLAFLGTPKKHVLYLPRLYPGHKKHLKYDL